MGQQPSSNIAQQSVDLEVTEFLNRVDKKSWQACIKDTKLGTLSEEEETCVRRIATKYLQTFTITKLMLHNEQSKKGGKK